MKNAAFFTFLLIFTIQAWALNLTQVNSEYRQIEVIEFNKRQMDCFVTNRSYGIRLANSISIKNNEFIQNLIVNNQMAQLRVVLNSNDRMLVQYWQTGHELIEEVMTRPQFSFDRDMLGLASLAQRDPDFSHLEAVSCFVGPSIFYYEHNLPGNFVMATHVESFFFESSTSRWWNHYLSQFRNWTKVITKHIQHWRNFVLSENTLNQSENPYPDLITGDLDMDVYKVAPGGLLHLKFGPNFDGKIVIVGGMFNNCFINNLLSISRALIDSARTDIEVEFPIYYVYAQSMGIYPEFNVEHDPLVYRLSDLYQHNPKEVVRLMRNMKAYLELMSLYQIEVVVPGEEGLSLKPKLHLSLETN